MRAGAGRDLAADRAAIERAVAGRTLVSAFSATADSLGRAPAVHWRPERSGDAQPGSWRCLTWDAFREQVHACAAGLHTLGVEPGSFVALVTRNHPAHLVGDQAVMHAGATPVSLYPTLSPAQLDWHVRHCGARVAVVESAALLDGVVQVPSLARVVAADAASADPRVVAWESVLAQGRRELARTPGGLASASVRPDDLATLIYTSGTTGTPKAVEVTHAMALRIEASMRLHGTLRPDDRLVSYLPLAHIAERFLTGWQTAVRGAQAWMCPDPAALASVLADARPTMFFGVPRVWEKLAAAVAPVVASGSPAPVVLARLGLERCRVAMTGGAPIDAEILELFRSLGLEVSEMWGLAETGPITWNGPAGGRIGTVGLPMPGFEVRLATDGELIARGPCVTRGYFRDPAATAEAFDADGWFHTGDVGTIDEDGYVRIVDRRKDLIVTSGAKTIAPVAVERLIKRHPLVAEACVVGDRRPYLVALVVLDPVALAAWASERGIEGDPAALAGHDAVAAEVAAAVAAANELVSRPEQVKRWTVLPGGWSVEAGELSATLKVRRDAVLRRYAEHIEAMYA